MQDMTKNFWVDTHCHLNFEVFVDQEQQVVARALAANVKRQIAISTYIADAAALRVLAERYSSVFFTVGTHPCNAHEPAEQAAVLADLLRLAADPKAVGFGESGLDYHYSKDTAKQQQTCFRLHCAAARSTQLPLVIHTRDADADMQAILREEMAKGAFPFILHCYSSGVELAKLGLELGGYVSFSGIATFKNAPLVREVVKLVPPERMLIETDAPYLAPVPYRGKTNEPSFVAQTGEFLAEFLGLQAADFAKQTTENAFRIFNKLR